MINEDVIFIFVSWIIVCVRLILPCIWFTSEFTLKFGFGCDTLSLSNLYHYLFLIWLVVDRENMRQVRDARSYLSAGFVGGEWRVLPLDRMARDSARVFLGQVCAAPTTLAGRWGPSATPVFRPPRRALLLVRTEKAHLHLPPDSLFHFL